MTVEEKKRALLTEALAQAVCERDRLQSQLAEAKQENERLRGDVVPREMLPLSVRRGLYAIIIGDNGATTTEVNAAWAWLASQGVKSQ